MKNLTESRKQELKLAAELVALEKVSGIYKIIDIEIQDGLELYVILEDGKLFDVSEALDNGKRKPIRHRLTKEDKLRILEKCWNCEQEYLTLNN